MQSERIFYFRDDSNNLQVKIPEIVDPKYGMFVWPSAPVLAQYIWFNRQQMQGKNVIELGAGTSLPGVVAALCGANVTLTDSEDFPECLENCRRSCQANDLANVHITGITWGQFSPNIFKLPTAHVILGSDCFYDTKDFDDILATVSFLMERNPEAKFWTTYQERSSGRTIEHLLKKWGLQCVHVPLELFGANHSNVGGSKLSDGHTIHMMEITKLNTASDDNQTK